MKPQPQIDIVYVGQQINVLFAGQQLTLFEMEGGKISKLMGRKAFRLLGESEWDLLLEEIGFTFRQSQCLKLYYWQGMTQKKIGEFLGICQWVVSFHLNRARRKMIDYFGVN